MTLHFSYGANMDRAAMARRCPGARALGTAILDGYRVHITRDGYASLASAPGAHVHGVLWRLSPRDLAALNHFESIASGLYRVVVLPVRLGSKRVSATVYLGRRSTGKPKPGYLDTVIEAARDWNLPTDYIAVLERLRPSAWRGRHPGETGAIG
jgi:gamma-glutamylcyclotransferase (GGCT)/AIG2-like uncharacterized protein YtfP